MDLICGLLFHSKPKVMSYSKFIGIDVSKKSLALSVRDESEEIYYCDVDNDKRSITKFIKQLKKEGQKAEETIVCMEHTGVYTYFALQCFHDHGFVVWIEHALNIKNSIGMTRGKNDKIDASRIANYACRYQDKLTKWKPQRAEMVRLKKLFAVRESLIRTKQRVQLSCTQHQGYEHKDVSKLSKSYLQPVLDKLKQQIKKVTDEIRAVIKSDERLKKLQKLSSSVTGVGEIVSWKMIITTNEFNDFENGRKFACYSGVVPFDHQSGSSLKSRARVSQMANKEMKTLLHMSAVAVISRGKGELFDYYQRKVAEGKIKMSVINALRNKIIQRVFACVKSDKMYSETYASTI